MAAKKTLLEIVQSILSDMDAEEVNSLGDTTEGLQVASIVQDTYYNIISNRLIPEHRGLIKLTALSDSEFPTHFKYGTDVSGIENVWYDGSTTAAVEYKEVYFLDPMAFLLRTDGVGGNYRSIDDKSAGTKLRIRTDKAPEYYTSFDDEHIVMDSYNSAEDATLQESKSRAFGNKVPVFSIEDTFVPDMDANFFPYLLAESKSAAFSLLKGGSDPKVEQSARRQKTSLQNDKYNTIRTRGLSKYGR